MRTVYLFRTVGSDHGTEGILCTDGFYCKTLELPWKNNQRNVSCIPAGIYIVKMRKSPRFGWCYWVTDVKGRSYILLHSGNYAGDKSKGWKSHVAGCLLLGLKHGFLGNQRAVLNSRIAVRRFKKFMNNETFKLHIVGSEILHDDYSRIMR